MLNFGSIPGDTEVTFPQGSLKKKILSLLVLKITKEMFRRARNNNNNDNN